MEITIEKNNQEEIMVDGIAVGYILVNENKKAILANIYDDFIFSKCDAELLKEFTNKINEYEWEESD